MDAIQVIERDHREVERLFDRFDRAARGQDRREQARLAREMVRELSLHAAIEEQVLYPALRKAGVEEERLDALEEHHAVKVLLAEIEATTPKDERFAAKVRLVAKSVRRHVEEEEGQLLPRLREALDAEALRALGAELTSARRSAPTRPHPAAPDTPPGNLFANAAAALVDRTLDALLDAVGVLRSMAEQGAQRGARAARDAASRVRRDGTAAVEQARQRGQHAFEDVRARGRQVVESAEEQGSELAGRIEHRAEQAAREAGKRARKAGSRARAGARGRKAHPGRARVKARQGGRARQRRRA